jgi:predicted PurR-regulated permease PerM
VTNSPASLPDERETRQHDPRRLIVFGVGAAIGGLALSWLIYTVRGTLVTVYISALFAMGISPLVWMIERQRVIPIGPRLPRWFAILVVYGAVLGSILLIGMIAIPPLVIEAQELRETLPERIQQVQDALVRFGILRQPITLGDAVRQAPATGAATAVSTVFAAVRNVVGGLFGVVTVLLLTFYMLVESREIRSFFVRLFPVQRRRRVATISETVTHKVSAWLGGQVMLGLIIGTTSAIGLTLMGVPYASVLALISAIGELIPMVGPILAAVPAILVAVTVSPGLAIGVAIFFLLQQQLENTVLVPKIMGRQVGLSAVNVIIALGIGSQLLGVVGAILSVPTAAIVQVLFDELVARDE